MDVTATRHAVRTLVEAGCLGGDPIEWLRESPESYARVCTLTQIIGIPHDDPLVMSAKQNLLSDELVIGLVDSLPARFAGLSADHHNPQFLPNRLNLLADMGFTRGDSARLDAVLDMLLASQDKTGRFTSGAVARQASGPVNDRCDNNAIVEVLVRFGLRKEPSVARALSRLASDVMSTRQGRGWACGPAKSPLARMPGRRQDACPQVTLEGLRCIAAMDAHKTKPGALAAARTPLEIWRRRPEERPYQFGHGYQFKTVRWPSAWYDVLAVLDTVGRFPALWSGPSADEADRTAVAELAACLIAYNVDTDGRVTPRRVHKGYESFSFGQKTSPSAFATARVLVAVARVADLAEAIAQVDVESLTSSKGGSGKAMPPERQHATTIDVCPMPSLLSYDPARVLPRVLTRHHLDRQWEEQSPESVVADIVGLVATSNATPYRSLAARIPDFSSEKLEQALDRRHSLVRWRGMRGVLQAFRRDFVPAVHAATSPQVIRHARNYLTSKGVTPKDYEQWAPRVLDALGNDALSLAEIRERTRPDADLGAIVTLMAAEGVLVRARPHRGPADSRMTFSAREAMLPGMDLERMSQDEARAQVLRAYVRGYGPVTQRDAAWWTGMDLKRVARATEALEDELVEIAIKGREGTWLMHAADAEELERAALMNQPCVSALPANDPLIVGYADRSRFIDDVARPFVFDSSNNAAPVVLVDGRIAAVWDVRLLERGGAAAEALVFPVAPLGAEATRLLEQAMVPVAQAIGVTIGSVRLVTGMTSLVHRPIGAFSHPLR